METERKVVRKFIFGENSLMGENDVNLRVAVRENRVRISI